jgi:hypothetical protein
MFPGKSRPSRGHGLSLPLLRRFVGRHQYLATASLFALAFAWFLITVAYPASRQQTHGFGAYYSAARLLGQGEISARIYDPAYFRPLVEADSGGRASDIYNANPPTTSLLLWPFVRFDIETARAIWTGLSLLLLLAGVVLLVRAFAPQARAPITLFFSTIALLFRPVIDNFRFGQAYVLVFFLLAVATVAFQRRRPGAGGLALALALVLKTAGWPLLLLLLWLRRWRFLAWAVAGAGLILLFTLPLFPLSMWLRYARLLAEVTRSPLICVTAYQTTRSLFCHLFAPQTMWLEAPSLDLPAAAIATHAALGLSVLGMLLILARRRATAAFVGVIAWSVLFAPLGEQYHHTVMLIPAFWLLGTWSRGEGGNWPAYTSLIAGLIAYITPYPIFHPRLQSGWWALLAYPRLYGAWLILFALFLHLWATSLPVPVGRAGEV